MGEAKDNQLKRQGLDLELRRARNLKWYVAIVGKNGETVFTSQRYWSRQNAHRAMVKAMTALFSRRKV